MLTADLGMREENLITFQTFWGGILVVILSENSTWVQVEFRIRLGHFLYFS